MCTTQLDSNLRSIPKKHKPGTFSATTPQKHKPGTLSKTTSKKHKPGALETSILKKPALKEHKPSAFANLSNNQRGTTQLHTITSTTVKEKNKPDRLGTSNSSGPIKHKPGTLDIKPKQHKGGAFVAKKSKHAPGIETYVVPSLKNAPSVRNSAKRSSFYADSTKKNPSLIRMKKRSTKQENVSLVAQSEHGTQSSGGSVLELLSYLNTKDDDTVVLKPVVPYR